MLIYVQDIMLLVLTLPETSNGEMYNPLQNVVNILIEKGEFSNLQIAKVIPMLRDSEKIPLVTIGPYLCFFVSPNCLKE